ncbi:MAG: hypothetical protein A2W35_08635 [Chloroflexi bacterium RBG_16_57_11]|nr:MAG: hypothetical protein A2W35_08635 [Chloroflexi bacterium RBG_16_57_11]
MNVRTNLHAGQSGTVDMEKLAALVQELDCQVSPMEMLGLAQKYCKNITADKIVAIMDAVGAGGGPAGLLSLFGG